MFPLASADLSESDHWLPSIEYRRFPIPGLSLRLRSKSGLFLLPLRLPGAALTIPILPCELLESADEVRPGQPCSLISSRQESTCLRPGRGYEDHGALARNIR